MSRNKWLRRAAAAAVVLAVPLTVAPKPAEAWWRGGGWGGGWGGWHGGWGWRGPGCCYGGWGWHGGIYLAPRIYAVPPPVYVAPPPPPPYYYYGPSAYVAPPSVATGSPLAGGNGGYGQHPVQPQ